MRVKLEEKSNADGKMDKQKLVKVTVDQTRFSRVAGI